MWGHLLTVLGVVAVFNLVVLVFRFAIREPSGLLIALAFNVMLYGGAILLLFLPPTSQASAEPVAVHRQTVTPAPQPQHTTVTPPTQRVVEHAPVPASPPVKAVKAKPQPQAVTQSSPPPARPPAPPTPPVDPRWQYQRYRIGEAPEAKTSAAPSHETVIIEQPERHSQYSRYAVPADRLTTQPGKPKALLVIHATPNDWSAPYYPSKYGYHFEATGKVLVRINGKDTPADLATINKSTGDIQSLSFKAGGTDPVTIYVYPAQP